MENFLVKLNSFLWGAPVLILLFAVGLLYAVKTRFFQFRHFKHILKNTAGEMFKKGSAKGDGTLTPLQAVSSALAGCVGTGNISGVATAIFVGGPGAVFWMWIISLFGMLTKCVEVTLAQYYRIKGKDGVFYGGPMYYIENGMGRKWKPLAVFFGHHHYYWRPWHSSVCTAIRHVQCHEQCLSHSNLDHSGDSNCYLWYRADWRRCRNR